MFDYSTAAIENIIVHQVGNHSMWMEIPNDLRKDMMMRKVCTIINFTSGRKHRRHR